MEVNGRHGQAPVALATVGTRLDAVHGAVPLVPVPHHAWCHKALQQVGNRWNILPFLEKQFCGDPQDSIEIRCPFGAHGGSCKAAYMLRWLAQAIREPPAAMTQPVFTEEQLKALKEPLSKDVVKTRSQSGRSLSYIEGWWAIHEANRIFGFGGWTQELAEVKCVSERERKIGRDQKDGWGVSYVATVRITVDGVKREGVGAGHGIDVDLGQAHESAIKEAATDAMKRALMTFGNQFGLALYDKDQRNVEDRPPSLEPVSEVEKATQRFIADLLERMEQVGINSDGIRTLKAILRVNEFEDVKETIRPTLIEKLTPEYAQKLNAGQNGKGEQVVQVLGRDIAESNTKLANAVDGAFK